MKDVYVTMYTPSLNLLVNNETINLSNSEIVSISFIHNYDTTSYPIIRLRIYADLTKIQQICENPDSILVRGCLNGGIYKMNQNTENESTLVKAVKSINISLKAYIEMKNIPSSTYDQYEDGKKKESDLNVNIKSPLELYCYNEQLVHYMKKRANSIYKDTSIGTVLHDILQQANVYNAEIDPITNPKKYNQVLIPNMNIIQSISFIDYYYGLYKKGGMMYGDLDKLYIANTDVYNGTTPIPIYVESYKNNNDSSGMTRINNDYQFYIMAPNVSVRSESDIERVLHGPKFATINLMDMSDIDIVELTNLFEEIKSLSLSLSENIEVPNLLHKTQNKYIGTSYVARLDERITKVDVSGTGFDIMRITPKTRFNLIFASPIRGIKIDKQYRATFVCHVLTSTDSGKFIAQTTMNLCTN